MAQLGEAGLAVATTRSERSEAVSGSSYGAYAVYFNIAVGICSSSTYALGLAL